MWTQRQLVDDLTDIGLPSGRTVLVHASLEAIGPIAGGAETLVAALREVVGPQGTLLFPTFTLDPGDPAEPTDPVTVEQPNGVPGDLSVARRMSQTDTNLFTETLRQYPDALHSDHPLFSFAAIGAEAEALTSHVPFHYPLGTDGPLARLHQRNGWILLVGVGHAVNASLHLAEIWANVPYIHRSAPLTTAQGEQTTMLGSPECSAGFAKIEPLLRQSRILRRGTIGSAESRLMRQQQTVSMAVSMLRGSPSALLCDDPGCRACALARRLTAEQVSHPNLTSGRD